MCPVSNDLKKSLTNLGFKGRYKRIPNVVNTKLFKPNKKQDAVFTILHASNLVNEHKNIEGILNAIAKLQNEIHPFVFKLIGENVHQYKSFAKKLGIKNETIIFKEHVTHKQMVTEFNNSNLFVLFSNFENLPCVILEAFSTGTPVISTDVGGINEFFPDDFGALIKKGDEEELIVKIKDFYKNTKLDISKMHTYVENNFSTKAIANQFSKLYYLSLKK